MGDGCGGCGKCCGDKKGSKNILHDLIEAKDFISGAELAKKYKITRQALNKQINKLQEQGYEISAVSNLGYKLISLPDKLDAAQIQMRLKTKFVGHEFDYYKSTSSTQEICWHAGLNDAGEGLVVVSESQTDGRGRLERKWVSNAGGIYFSVLLRPSFLTLRDVPKLTLALGVAVRRVVLSEGFQCGLKWPNDILLNGKKLCGILCELDADMDRVHFLVAGIGININNKDLPKEGTSLFLEGQKKYDRVQIFTRLLNEIEAVYLGVKQHGFEAILKEWQEASVMIGKNVKVKILNKTIEGVAQAIDNEGRLLVKTANGKIEKIHSGDIEISKKTKVKS